MSLDPQKATLKPDSSFILASSSPRRKDLLQDLISQFEVVSAEVDELENHPSGPESLVLENAKLKCQKVAEIYPDFWVLGADTLVALGNEVLGKPINIELHIGRKPIFAVLLNVAACRIRAKVLPHDGTTHPL